MNIKKPKKTFTDVKPPEVNTKIKLTKQNKSLNDMIKKLDKLKKQI